MASARSSGSSAALLSLDVFDTALIRVMGTPASLFLILGKRLLAAGVIRCSAEAFARARIEANRRARANAGRGVGLADIYGELQYALDLTDAERDGIRAEELALEEELIRPVPGAAERLAHARASGLAVAFLSDMYLPSSFIRGQLERHGLWMDGDGCYVSCEAGCGKEDGRGYRLMAQAENVPLRRVIHRGNDPRADVTAAWAAGATAEPFLEGNLNRYEEALASHSYATEGLSSVMAGAARLARLAVPATTPREVALRDVAASVVGPTLASFILWLLLRARASGVRRLCFAGPDDGILMRMAESLNVKLDLDLEVRGLVGGELQPASADARSWALVDLFGSGQRLGALHRTRSAGAGTIPAAFVFARVGVKNPDITDTAVPTRSYFSDQPLRRGYLGRLDEWHLRLLCGADRGGSDGLPIIHEALLSFADALWLDPEVLELSADMRPAVAEVTRMFFESPSPAEARAWGTSPAQPQWREGALATKPPLTRALLRSGLAVRRRLASALRAVLRRTPGIR
jgi:FMN phosphatase YigB (HAD superfamily)